MMRQEHRHAGWAHWPRVCADCPLATPNPGTTTRRIPISRNANVKLAIVFVTAGRISSKG